MTIEEVISAIVDALGRLGNRRQHNQAITAALWALHRESHDRFEFNQSLARMMNRLDIAHDNNLLPLVDKRIGAIIYDTLAPASAELNAMDITIQIERDQARLSTSTGSNLDDQWGYDYTFPRFEASGALRIAETFNRQNQLDDFPLGTEFIEPPTIGNELIYVLEETSGGTALLRAYRRERDPLTNERLPSGTRGHSYFGRVIPIQATNNLARCVIIGTQIPGQDRELDNAYRARIIRHLRRNAFGGNVAQYQQVIESIPGVGRVLVFPVWRGSGTSRVSILDSANMPVTDEFIKIVEELIDPRPRSGTGFSVFGVQSP